MDQFISPWTDVDQKLLQDWYGICSDLEPRSRSAVIVIHEADLWVKFLPELYPPPLLYLSITTLTE